jgi:TonB family protein
MSRRLMTMAAALIVPTALVAAAQEIVYDGVTLPKVIKQVRAQYPSTDIREQGTVTMECVVQSDGKVGEVTVVQSLEPRLDEAAVAALKQWEFEPGTRNGEPVAVRVAVEMAFSWK